MSAATELEPAARHSTYGTGIASLVVGICAFVVAFVPFVDVLGLLAAIVAVILGARGIRRAESKGLAIAGLALGCVAILVSLFVGFAALAVLLPPTLSGTVVVNGTSVPIPAGN